MRLKILSFVTFVFFTQLSFAQNVGVGTNSPHPSAILEIKSIDKGLLLPRLNNYYRQTMPAPATGLLVYDSIVKKMYWYDGSQWVSEDSTKNIWRTSGNSNIDPSYQFIGTRDNSPLVFKINNTYAGSLTEKNISLGLNTTYYFGTATNNIAIGNYALIDSRDKNNIIAIGDSALIKNGTGVISNFNGIENTAVGSKALQENSTGSHNTAVGYQSMRSNSGGFQNMAMGTRSLYQNVSGYDNVAAGYNNLISNISGNGNSAFGKSALSSNISGNNNTAAGNASLFSNTTGYSNVAMGVAALTKNTISSNLVAIGDSALYNNGTGTSNLLFAAANTAVGSKALLNNSTGYNNSSVGSNAAKANTSGFLNVAIGNNALLNNNSGRYNTAVGAESLRDANNSSGNTSIGNAAMAQFYNSPILVNTNNTAVGNSALMGFGNVNNGVENVAIGYKALYANGSGSFNVTLGNLAMNNNSSGSKNVVLGYNAMLKGFSNIGNVVIGYKAGEDLTAYGNVFIGESTGSAVTTGYDNVWVGKLTGNSGTPNYFNSIALGSDVAISASNQARIGNALISSIGGQVNWSVFSDGRFKTDVKENIPGLEFIKKLRPVTYHYNMELLTKNNENKNPEQLQNAAAVTYSGFIAQEVEASAKLVGYNFSGVDKPQSSEGNYALRYAEFTVPLVKAVQEQQQMIEEMKVQINLLKQELEHLKNKP